MNTWIDLKDNWQFQRISNEDGRTIGMKYRRKPGVIMKILSGILILVLLSACNPGSGGGAGSGGTAPTNPPAQGNDTVWTLEITGNNTVAVILLVADQNTAQEEQMNPGLISIGVGETKTYQVTGAWLNEAQIGSVTGTPFFTLTQVKPNGQTVARTTSLNQGVHSNMLLFGVYN
jgi:hypothetical protein